MKYENFFFFNNQIVYIPIHRICKIEEFEELFDSKTYFLQRNLTSKLLFNQKYSKNLHVRVILYLTKRRERERENRSETELP